ncbi:MAG TPA: hypothetical protein VLE49_06875 [Anaerolineales bacterium]|nr:hypothetical protein [Anaerolineales bacterium]
MQIIEKVYSLTKQAVKYTGRIFMAKKFDGVIEAVRYKNGQIAVVRVFERRGSTFSDRVLLDRKEFLDRLKKGQNYRVGKRKELLASTFEVQEKPVQILKQNGREVISTRSDADHDELEQAPVF